MLSPVNSQSETATTCPYCGVGCGVLVTPSEDGQTATVRGDPHHPSNYGRLCSKGSALGETLNLEERFLWPEIGGKRASWDEALDKIARSFTESIRQYGPDSVAFYVSGQILTEDYYIANKLMKGFIGASNIDTNSRLCMASSVAGHKRAFGSDTVPGCYDDLEQADLIIMVGSNLAWCHPVLHQRILAVKEKRPTRLVIIDPRATATTDAADLHLKIKPGADVLLFNALFEELANSEARNDEYIRDHTNDLETALAAVDKLTLSELSALTDLPSADLELFFNWVISTPRTVTIYSQGVNQASTGTDKVNAIINTHLVTGRIGKPGCGPFSVTGQPNAMGGREVGGLANQLAAHMDFSAEDVDRVQRFWKAPSIASTPGLKAVDLFDAVAAGRIKALWIMATNPVVSMPDADKVKAAIRACPMVVVSEVVSSSDTFRLADIGLPATAWGEKNGTVTNSERRISRQRSFLTAPGETRHDWWALCEVAKRMGFQGFDFTSPADIYREYAELSAFENNDTRDFDIGAHAQISDEGYDALEPFQWPLTADRSRPGKVSGAGHRFFGSGEFYTTDRKARFVATPFLNPASIPEPEFPFVFNTGRIRDHWHTMTRTGKTSRLSDHIAEPFLEIHPADAEDLNICPADLVKVSNRHGKIVLRVLVTDRVRKGNVFAPMHWTDRYASSARIDSLVPPVTDPVSGQPESKHATVAIERFSAGWHGFVVAHSELTPAQLEGVSYWATARTDNGWRYELAGSCAPSEIMKAVCESDQAISVTDANGQQGRAVIKDDKLQSYILLSTDGPAKADRTWIASLPGATINNELRNSLLAGRPAAGKSTGRTICSCLGIGSTTITNAVFSGARTVDGVGAATGAGTNCGSCKPEIRRLIRSYLADMADLVTQAAE